MQYIKKIKNKCGNNNTTTFSKRKLSLLVFGIILTSFTIQNVLGQEQDSFHSILVHLDKTENILNDYGVFIKNIDTGELIDNLYTDDGKYRYVDIPGSIDASEGERLLACAMQIDTEQIACAGEMAYGPSTEFYIDMNARVALQSSEDIDIYHGDLNNNEDREVHNEDPSNNNNNNDINEF
jgi:hypothetical protein